MDWPGQLLGPARHPQYGEIFRKSVWVSFVYVAVSITVKFFLGMAMALLLNKSFRGRAFMRGLLFAMGHADADRGTGMALDL